MENTIELITKGEIENNTIYIEKVSGTTNGIKNKASNVVISGNNVVVYGPCAGIDWAGDGIVKTIAIATLGGDNVTIANNTAKALQAPNSVVEMYGSIDAVELKGTNIRVENNNITAKAEGAGFVYALNGLGMADVNITNNTIEAYSERYIVGIQIGSDFISGIDGANVLIASFLGQGKDREVERAVHTAIVLALICVVVVSLITKVDAAKADDLFARAKKASVDMPEEKKAISE